MPKLYQKDGGGYYTKRQDLLGHVITLQIHKLGGPLLRERGIRVGQELGEVYRELRENCWLYTLGEQTGGGELGGLHDQTPEPFITLTVPWKQENPLAPRFLFSKVTSTYYTKLYIENSSDYWFEVQLLIKHHGAIQLQKLGAVVGEEFTQKGIRLIIERRWAYSDDLRVLI